MNKEEGMLECGRCHLNLIWRADDGQYYHFGPCKGLEPDDLGPDPGEPSIYGSKDSTQDEKDIDGSDDEEEEE